ncbi:MAG: efflux RND transporter periplasmic adaptor subunit [Aquificaceae bacterium]|nr:efflux RND transporter periplasmic adaptor subunit [Aquificaceae bacterium]MCS7308067.1 efflux RND transporter periplasmic adaptor subunit [Aquificaceae bacterium]MCX8075459.1 efflux RND transporter periplasmic adaptor subunit [Aquificaceae bacterium]
MILLLNLLFVLVVFSQEVKVSAIVQGMVEKIYVKEGQRVEKGDVLLRIDPVLYTTQRDSLKAQLEAQKATLEKMERDFKRYEELFNRGLLSRSEYEDWKNKYEKELSHHQSLKAQVERVEKLIEYCTIRSPVRGVVRRILVREGVFVNGTVNPEHLLTIQER